MRMERLSAHLKDLTETKMYVINMREAAVMNGCDGK